jgi:hypothetical protein
MVVEKVLRNQYVQKRVVLLVVVIPTSLTLEFVPVDFLAFPIDKLLPV